MSTLSSTIQEYAADISYSSRRDHTDVFALAILFFHGPNLSLSNI